MRQTDSQVKRFTGGQLKLEKILNELGFSTILELEVDIYRVDVYVPELKVAFEYDGKGYHTKKRDAARDAAIKDIGIHVIRIVDKNLNREYVKQRIAEEIDEGE